MAPDQSEFDINEYITNLLADETIDDATKETFSGVLARDGVSARLKEGYLRQSDYSRNMDHLRTKEEQLESEIERSRTFYNDQIDQDHNNMTKWSALQQENAQLKSSSSDFSWDDPADPPATPDAPTNVVTQKEFKQALATLEQQSISLLGQTVNKVQEHMRDYDEPLDAVGLYSYAVEKKLPIDTAYDHYTKETREEARTKKHKADIDEAREAGAQDARSKMNLPAVDVKPRGIHALKPPKDVPTTRKDRVAAAVKDFMTGGDN